MVNVVLLTSADVMSYVLWNLTVRRDISACTHKHSGVIRSTFNIMKETRGFTVHNTSVLYSLTLNYYIKLCGTIIITITIRIIGFAE